eukprot:TRINITY_DN88842_c0_g1_i1.p1 TRINITY_DN88842_c0_g1~~TRINITY_DN88842_c0_g1_i1.p1  ORF type:complete len:536 (-),score=71.59 TRINITY_DN88842_c0_g1_i1:10-1617(-)
MSDEEGEVRTLLPSSPTAEHTSRWILLLGFLTISVGGVAWTGLHQARRAWHLESSLGLQEFDAGYGGGEGDAFRGINQADMSSGISVRAPAVQDGFSWGCGLVGSIPGINKDGTTTAETQRFIDAVKGSSDGRKITYWNWALNPSDQALTSDFIFMPEQWGAGTFKADSLHPAGTPAGSSGAQMANILLGMNEPDIKGSCLDSGMFGRCLGPCDHEALASGDCPSPPPPPPPSSSGSDDNSARCKNGKVISVGQSVSGISPNSRNPFAPANSRGQCNCTGASGAGFWSLHGCRVEQPLPGLFTDWDAGCIDVVKRNWREMASAAAQKGFKYLSTPLIAQDMRWGRSFIEEACQCSGPGSCQCTEISCGCPTHVAFHWYAFDCRPVATGSWDNLQKKLDFVGEIMDDYPFIQGALINEVGILNCAPKTPVPGAPPDPAAGCLPDSGEFPAQCQEGNRCPSNEDLPDGMPSFIDQLFNVVINAMTNDGRQIVKGLSWFNLNGDGGTYDLELFDLDGSVNELGEAYMRNCQKWGVSRR